MHKLNRPSCLLGTPFVFVPPERYLKMFPHAKVVKVGGSNVIHTLDRPKAKPISGEAPVSVAHLEQAMVQARELILDKLPVMASGDLGPWFVTVGDPKLRLLPRDVDQFSPDAVLRRWRSGVTQLRKINPDLIGVCAVELQLCKTIDRPGSGEPRYYFEPHIHCIIYGVSKAQIRAAFKVRRDPTVTVRKRFVKVQNVYDLGGAVSYMTKARPEFRNQYLKDGKPRWGRSKIPPRHKAKWLRVMARYQATDLLSSTGISLRILG